MKKWYSVDESIVIKANDYFQVLYEQFGLSTKEAPKITDNHQLKNYLT